MCTGAASDDAMSVAVALDRADAGELVWACRVQHAAQRQAHGDAAWALGIGQATSRRHAGGSAGSSSTSSPRKSPSALSRQHSTPSTLSLRVTAGELQGPVCAQRRHHLECQSTLESLRKDQCLWSAARVGGAGQCDPTGWERSYRLGRAPAHPEYSRLSAGLCAVDVGRHCDRGLVVGGLARRVHVASVRPVRRGFMGHGHVMRARAHTSTNVHAHTLVRTHTHAPECRHAWHTTAHARARHATTHTHTGW